MTEVHAVSIVPRYGIPFVIMRGESTRGLDTELLRGDQRKRRMETAFPPVDLSISGQLPRGAVDHYGLREASQESRSPFAGSGMPHQVIDEFIISINEDVNPPLPLSNPRGFGSVSQKCHGSWLKSDGNESERSRTRHA